MLLEYKNLCLGAFLYISSLLIIYMTSIVYFRHLMLISTISLPCLSQPYHIIHVKTTLLTKESPKLQHTISYSNTGRSTVFICYVGYKCHRCPEIFADWVCLLILRGTINDYITRFIELSAWMEIIEILNR